MKINKLLKILFKSFILSIIILFQSCAKDEHLILNEEYLTVSDISHYCSGSCYETIDWEGKEVKVKGHIEYYQFNNNFSYQSYSINYFWLIDIRNNKITTVNFFNISDLNDKKLVVDKILSAKETDMFYITGTLQSIEKETMFTCNLGCKIILSNVNDIYFK